mgnify:FL=1
MANVQELTGAQWREYVAPIQHAQWLAASAAWALLRAIREHVPINVQECERRIKRSNQIVGHIV